MNLKNVIGVAKMMKEIEIDKLQPSQLYIEKERFQKIFDEFDPENYEPVPVKKLDGELILTDGHTRALVAYLKGLKKIKFVWEDVELDWDVYRLCVKWCKKEGIFKIKDLKDRMINEEDFHRLWCKRCRRAIYRIRKRRKEHLTKIIEKIIKLPEIANKIKSLKEKIKSDKGNLIQEEITQSIEAHKIELPDIIKSVWISTIKGNTEEHLHPKSIEHTFVLEGKGFAKIENRKIKLNKGKWIIIDWDTPHRFHTENIFILLSFYTK